MNKKLFKRLVKFFKIMSHWPEIMTMKLLEHKIFNQDWIDQITENSNWDDISYDSFNSIKNINELEKKFDDIFKTTFTDDIEHKNLIDLSNELNNSQLIWLQLQDYVEDENYEIASKIKKYLDLIDPNFLLT